jgi:hypothetical protein
MPAITPRRHELFAHNAIRAARIGESQRWAYLASGYNCTPGAADVSAHHLLKNPKIQRRIAELSRPAVRKAQASAASLLADLASDRALALRLGQPSAAIAATVAKAKIAGLWVQKVEKGEPHAFDKAETLRLIAERHGDEVATLLARALGDVGSSPDELPTPNEKA